MLNVLQCVGETCLTEKTSRAEPVNHAVNWSPRRLWALNQTDLELNPAAPLLSR